MLRIPKSMFSFGALFLAVGVLTLAVPRAAHAVAAALVQVNNTAANPAIMQSVSSQAAQLVRLIGYATPNSTDGQPFYISGGLEDVGYSVPAGQSLVVTAVDITPPCASDTVSVGLYGVAIYTVSGPNTTHFEYPSGIVFPPGTNPSVVSLGQTTTAGDCFQSTHVNVYGYLTSN
jgi:hypothetical protein